MATVPTTTSDEPVTAEASGADSKIPIQAQAQTNSGGQFLAGLGQLNVFRQLGLMVGLTASVAIGFAVVLWSQGEDFQPVYGNMEGYEPGAIMTALEAENIDYRVDPNSGVILVPAADIADVRIRLAAAGITRFDGTGYELLDQEQGFGTSQYMELNRVKRSQEGELQRTIANFRNIESARVLIAVPERSVFVRSARKPTASVFVELNSAAGLSPTQVEAIVNLVASSVPELEPADVTVVDQRGNLLTRESGDSSLDIAEKQFQYRRILESSLAERVGNILRPIVGVSGFQAEVTADLDFTQVEQAAESYDPQERVVRSEHTRSVRSNGDDVSEGVPGTLTNQPPPAGSLQSAEEAAEPGVASQESSIEAIRAYELGRQISYTNHDPVAINRISVAVVLDDRPAADGSGTLPWEEAQLEQLTVLVRDAVGFDEERGDSVTVINNSFARPTEIPLQAVPIWQQGWLQNLLKQGLAGLFVLLIVLGVLRPVLKNLAAAGSESRQLALAAAQGNYSQVELAEQALAREDVRLSGGPADSMLPGPGGTQNRHIDTVRNLVAEDPARVAQVVKQWVSSDGD